MRLSVVLLPLKGVPNNRKLSFRLSLSKNIFCLHSAHVPLGIHQNTIAMLLVLPSTGILPFQDSSSKTYTRSVLSSNKRVILSAAKNIHSEKARLHTHIAAYQAFEQVPYKPSSSPLSIAVLPVTVASRKATTWASRLHTVRSRRYDSLLVDICPIDLSSSFFYLYR